MNLLGLHGSALAPEWDPGRIEPHMDRLKERGVGLIEVPLPKPFGVDAARARAFARRWNVELMPMLALPRTLDILDRPQDGLDFLEPAFRFGAEVGATGLGGLTSGSIGSTAGLPSTVRQIDGLCRILERAARAARPHGLTLGLEPLNRYETHLINRARDAARIVERIGAENLRVHLDTGRMHVEEASFADAFGAAAAHLGFVRASEANRDVPGRGMVNWESAFKALADIGYSGPITLGGMDRAGADASAGPSVRPSASEREEDAVDEGLSFLRDKARAAGLALGR